MYFDTIANLIAQTSVTAGIEYIVGGFYDAGDGGGGTFIWIPASAPHSDPDGGIIFNTTNLQNGYFQRIFSGPVNVRWFGAIYELGVRDDLTTYVHAARDSQAFANNGTLYFPKGVYPGAFVFVSDATFTLNEFNLVGDGQGTILMTNGYIDHFGFCAPVLILGCREVHWRWAKVSNLKIEGYVDSTHRSDGVEINQIGNAEVGGRWIFEHVFFYKCRNGVYKPAGNIGNHYIDCTWRENIYGVFAHGPLGMHSGCDRYSGGHFTGNTKSAVYYEDANGGGGQIILDGVVMEGNPGWGIQIKYTLGAQFSQCAISIRNVYFEGNGINYSNGNGDAYFEGVRSVRIDDGAIWCMTLIESSVNLYNCSNVPGGERLEMDSRSSLVAYEHRYSSPISEKLFVNSISYDATPELYGADKPSSVWGPLRVVTSVKDDIVVSDHFDSYAIVWDDFNSTIYYTTGSTSFRSVLGNGSNVLSLPANKEVWAASIYGYVKAGKYVVWSIHTYIESDAPTVEEFHGEIISEDLGTVLGYVYFRPNQWVCSYGMRYVADTVKIRLAFKTGTAFSANNFYITDYQIVEFDDLASANSFVNSREFASYGSER